MPVIEGKRPTIVAQQRRETLHRGAVDALIYHLIERKGAALAGAIDVGERNRRSRKFGCIRAVTVAGCAMAARTILGEKRSEEHTSELQSLMRISYAVFCLKKKKKYTEYVLSTTEHTTN